MKQGNIEERFHKEFKTIWIKTQCSQIGLNPNIGRKSYLVNPNEVLAFIKQEMGRVIGEDEVEFKVNGKQKLEYKASDSYYNPVRNRLKAQQRREAGIK